MTMPAIALVAAWLSLAAIAAIGVALVATPTARRQERGDVSPQAPGVDPAQQRRRRPFTNRLAGALLLAADAVLVIALWPVLS